MTGGQFDVAYQWFTWPWQLLAALVAGFAHGMTRLPLIGFAWRMRLAVVGIALWQTVVASQHAATVGIVMVIGLTSLPWTRARHERLVAQAHGSRTVGHALRAGDAASGRATSPAHRDHRTPTLHLCAEARGMQQPRTNGDLYGRRIHGPAHDPSNWKKGSRS